MKTSSDTVLEALGRNFTCLHDNCILNIKVFGDSLELFNNKQAQHHEVLMNVSE